MMLIFDIVRGLVGMVENVCMGNFVVEDLCGLIFIISNFGVIGGIYLMLIINVLEILIFLIGCLCKMLVVIGDEVKVCLMMLLSILYDY